MGQGRGGSKRSKIDWTHVFEHNSEKVFVSGNNLGSSGESMIRGSVKERDYGRAEIALLGNCVRQVKFDGVMKFNRDRGQTGADIPSEHDPEKGTTHNQEILTYLISHVAPHLLDMFPGVFDEYMDDELESELEELDAARPTESPGRKVPTGSQAGGGTSKDS